MPRVVARLFSLPLKRTPKFHYHRRTEVSTGANRGAGTRGLARQSSDSNFGLGQNPTLKPGTQIINRSSASRRAQPRFIFLFPA
jgi:hypothetical protein